MKNNSFAMAMDKIVGQHEAEQKRELQAQQRAVMMSRIRSGFVCLFFAASLSVAYCYRDDLSKTIMPYLSPKPSASRTGQAATALSAAQQNAATRDSVIDQVSK
jgi:hypothetical protein